MTKLLITRPAPFTAESVSQLNALGYDCVMAPMLSARHVLPFPVALNDAPILLVTSPQAALALAAWTELQYLPVLAVGARTASLLLKAGFTDLISADSDGAGLLRLIAAAYAGPQSFLLAVAPQTGHAMQASLQQAGHLVTRLDVYEMTPVASLPDAALTALRDGSITHALFTSARGASTFLALAEQANLMASLSDIAAICLSEAVANAARAAQWRDIMAAAEPTTASLHRLLPAIG